MPTNGRGATASSARRLALTGDSAEKDLGARPFTDHAVNFQKVLPKLLQRVAERKKSFRVFAFHIAGQPLVSHRAELLDVIAERELDRVQRRRRFLGAQGTSAGAEEIAS